MENIAVNGKFYGYVVDYKNDDSLRNSFNNLARKIYGFDFEAWYKNGYWKDKYIPYSMVDGNTIVSNVSVNIIDFLVSGVKRTYLQIGTVMTDPNYRNHGLNRILMERILKNWRGKCDLIYLFANDSVLHFYPKFGFTIAKEYQHFVEVKSENTEPDFIKLEMSNQENKNFLFNKVNQSFDFSKVSMLNNATLVMFYCTSFMDQNVYYLERLDAIAIAEFKDNILFLNDIYCKKEVSINDIILSLVNKEIKKVVLGFTPKTKTTFDEKILKEENSTLFIIDDKWDLFKYKKLRFPVLSHA